jgi:hypothetical protein
MMYPPPNLTAMLARHYVRHLRFCRKPTLNLLAVHTGLLDLGKLASEIGVRGGRLGYFSSRLFICYIFAPFHVKLMIDFAGRPRLTSHIS